MRFKWCCVTDELILVALGPLTNISMAIKMDPEFGYKLKHCYIMGGNYQGMNTRKWWQKINKGQIPNVSALLRVHLASYRIYL